LAGHPGAAGARPHDGAGADQGSGYVFLMPGGGWVNGSQTAKLTALDGAAGDNLGGSVSISGDTVVLGAAGDDITFSDQGSAYVYTQPGGGWANMTQTAKLTASDSAASDALGTSVAIFGDVIVSGASQDDAAFSDQGSVYVYIKTGVFWFNSVQSAKLLASDAAASDGFGASVSGSGDYVLVGARGDDGGAGSDQGSAYVFERCGAGWSERAKFTPANAAAGDELGSAVALEGDVAVAGAPLDDGAAGTNQGGATLFLLRDCPDEAVALGSPNSPICTGQLVQLPVLNSQVGVMYQMRADGLLVGSPVAGTGGQINVSGVLTSTYSQVYSLTVLAIRDLSGCALLLQDSRTVQVNPAGTIPASAFVAPAGYCSSNIPQFIELTVFGGFGQTLEWFTGSCGGTLVGTGNQLNIPAPNTTTTYYARWTNGCGPSGCVSTTLNVNTPVSFTLQPANQVGCVGGSASFTVAGTGDPPPAYLWRKNGATLSNGGNISGATTPTLTINPVDVASAGSYDVYISNPCGFQLSEVVTLTIIDSAPVFFEQPQSQATCAGGFIGLFHSTTGGPVATRQWRRNGVPIPGATGASLDIYPASVADAGNYDVVVTNACGSVTSDPAVVNVWPVGTGDGNGDGQTNAADCQGFVEALLAIDGIPAPNYCPYDMTADDTYVDDRDIPLFISALVGP
jgi:hypothetical protein